MQDEVAEIDQYPFAGFQAFAGDDIDFMLAQMIDDMVSQGAGLAIGQAGGDDHAIKKARKMGGIKDFDVVGFAVFKGIDHKALQFLYVHLVTIALIGWFAWINLLADDVIMHNRVQHVFYRQAMSQPVADLRGG